MTVQKLFISYTHRDKTIATRLALILSQNTDLSLFIDHWDMTAGDSLLDRLEEAINDSAHIIVLLSKSSVESKWVRTEMRYAYYREQELGRKIIVPVIIEDCDLPIHVAGRIHVDLRTNENLAIENIRNFLQNREPFSKIVSKILSNSGKVHESPYKEKCIREGRRVLITVAQFMEMDVEEHQLWLLWELFHRYLSEGYRCTIKVGRNPYYDRHDSFLFMLIDRWTGNSCNIELSTSEARNGMWAGTMDHMHSCSLRSTSLSQVRHRLSAESKYSPQVHQNPFLDAAGRAVAPVLEATEKELATLDAGSIRSFLFDLQYAVLKTRGLVVDCVAGSYPDDLCHASPFGASTQAWIMSQMPKDSCENHNNSIVFELYDRFFRSLKIVALCAKHQQGFWEGDIDLMSGEFEVIVGPP